VKVTDITRGKATLQRLIADFEKTREFNDLIKTIEYFMAEKITESGILESVWSKHNTLIPKANYLAEWSLLLQKISVIYYDEPSQAPVVDIPVSAALESAKAATLHIIDGWMENSRKAELRKPVYSWFNPSVRIADLLEAIYPEDINPGHIIGKFLNCYYPQNCIIEGEDFYSDYPMQEVYNVTKGSGIHKLIIEISMWVLNCYRSDPNLTDCLKSCVRDILDPQNSDKVTNPYAFQTLYDCAVTTPKEFFYLWIKTVYLDYYLYTENIKEMTNDEFEVIITNAPIGKYSYSYSEKSKLVKQSDIKYKPNDKYLSYNSIMGLIENHLDYSNNRLDEDGKVLLRQFNNTIAKVRNDYLGGISPFEVQSSYNACFCMLDNIDFKDVDLLLILPVAILTYSKIELEYSGVGDTYFDKMSFYNNLQDIYITLFNKAVKEGHTELGISLLSLYILRRSFVTKARFGDMPALVSVIEEAMKLNGAKILRHTLNLICDIIKLHYSDDKVSASTLMHFERFIVTEPKLHVLQGGKEDKDVQAKLEKELGMVRWNKLTPESRKTLVSAEYLWRNSAMEFGFGIQDLSGIISPFCKVFEIELVQKLKPFYMAEEYKEYQVAKGQKKDGKPTGGSLLYEVKSYHNLPEHLQKLLSDCPIKLVGNKELVLGLIDIVTNYRNKSTHTEIMEMKRFFEFREKIFEKKLLHSFIDAFN